MTEEGGWLLIKCWLWRQQKRVYDWEWSLEIQLKIYYGICSIWKDGSCVDCDTEDRSSFESSLYAFFDEVKAFNLMLSHTISRALRSCLTSLNRLYRTITEQDRDCLWVLPAIHAPSCHGGPSQHEYLWICVSATGSAIIMIMACLVSKDTFFS